jgi:hypothetical protein
MILRTTPIDPTWQQPEAILAAIITEMAYYDKPETKRNAQFHIAYGGLLQHGINEGVQSWDDLSGLQQGAVGTKNLPVAMTMTMNHLYNRLRAAQHAMYFILRAAGVEIEWPADWVGKRNFSTMIQRATQQHHSLQEPIGYLDDRCRTVEEYSWRASLPVLHLMAAWLEISYRMERYGRPVTMLDVCHNTGFLILWLGRAETLQGAIAAEWAPRVARSGQISLPLMRFEPAEI